MNDIPPVYLGADTVELGAEAQDALPVADHDVAHVRLLQAVDNTGRHRAPHQVILSHLHIHDIMEST